jgi:MFS family permease
MMELSFKTHVQTLLGILIPAKVIQLVGLDQKGLYLGLCLFGGAGMAAIFGPIFGLLSDHTVTMFGRRRIWIFLGIIGDCIALVSMAFANNIWWFIVSYICVATSVTASAAPFAGLIADVVPTERTTSTAGYVSSFGFFGTLLGGIIGIIVSVVHDLSIGFAILTFIMVMGMLITVIGTNEDIKVRMVQELSIKKFILGFITPFLNSSDYRWSIVTQFVMQLGLDSIRTFLQYWLRDSIVFPLILFDRFSIRDEIAATSLLMTIMAITSLPSSFLVGKLTEFYSMRAIFVSVSSIYLLGLPLMMCITTEFWIVLVFAVLFGIGNGSYTALGWSIAIDTLPKGELQNNAQSLGLWQTCRIVATVFSGTVSGIALDVFQKLGQEKGIPNLGYIIIFGFSSFCFVIGGFLIWFIKIARSTK